MRCRVAEPLEIDVQATPNPNSMRFTLNRVVVEKGSRSYLRAEQAEGSPLGRHLLAIPGVRSVFMVANFVSVGRDPARDWSEIVPKVREALGKHFQ
jgi:hypothetical protein